ncbi:MAG: AraC family transcriptional regulator [Acinetobacter sp.]
MDALSKIFDDIHLAKSEYLYLNVFHQGGFHYQHEPSMLAYIILQGQAQLKFADGEILELQQGDLALLPSSSAHHVYCPTHSDFGENLPINAYFQSHAKQSVDINPAEQSSRSFILAIRSSLDIQMAKPLLTALPEYLHIQHILGDTAPEWLQVGLQFLALETQQLRPGRDKILDHLVSILLIECVRDYILNLENASSWLNALSHPELSNALAAIHGQPERAWTVESLAEQCHMSRSKFAQLFTQIVGEPPLAYLQQHRLRLAAQYLRNSGFSIQQIAHWVGYSSETAFSQSFKKQFEQTPSQYRLMCQKHKVQLAD